MDIFALDHLSRGPFRRGPFCRGPFGRGHFCRGHFVLDYLSVNRSAFRRNNDSLHQLACRAELVCLMQKRMEDHGS
ncbi:hypothetical protein M513_13161 [Trichuris suis]|uniref:Uncharacterized protein n=1 Tax=Trichuris suis TaxID=68888 RepID=A0A085LLV8_9BILA|nr:hypothetical protein M513_13161 [Trichuris suis]